MWGWIGFNRVWYKVEIFRESNGEICNSKIVWVCSREI